MEGVYRPTYLVAPLPRLTKENIYAPLWPHAYRSKSRFI
jgi:hypothetical protein